MNAIGHITTNKSVNLLECVVVWAIWIVDIGLGSLVVELLTRVVGISCFVPGPFICFRLYVHSSFPTTDILCIFSIYMNMTVC